jgi:hypothetical protein
MFPNHVSVSLKSIALNKSICSDLQTYLHTPALSICGIALSSTSPQIFLKVVAFAVTHDALSLHLTLVRATYTEHLAQFYILRTRVPRKKHA